jgi:nitrite reductase/ring-hydroxylating ferredoxin subunit
MARRLRKTAETPSIGEETVVCSKCGQRFAIHNGAHVTDAQIMEKQVAWLEDQLVWDHIQERKHHGSVEVPNLS